MWVSDFIIGLKYIHRLSAEERMQEVTVASAGAGMSDGKHIDSIYKHFELQTRDPEQVKRALEIKRKWQKRGVSLAL